MTLRKILEAHPGAKIFGGSNIGKFRWPVSKWPVVTNPKMLAQTLQEAAEEYAEEYRLNYEDESDDHILSCDGEIIKLSADVSLAVVNEKTNEQIAKATVTTTVTDIECVHYVGS